MLQPSCATPIARGVFPGPRILTSIRQLNERSGTPDEIRQKVRQLKTDGADVLKIFASAGIRDGGKQTMTDDQLRAACGEARTQGLRTMVHAHSPESITASVNAGCQQIEHGVFANDAVLEALAARDHLRHTDFERVHERDLLLIRSIPSSPARGLTTTSWRAVVSRSCPTYFAGGIIGRCSAICVIDP